MSNVTPPITVHPEVQAGTPCFTGTRVPVKALFDVLSSGRTVAYFLENFSTVDANQVREVLQRAGQLVANDAAAMVAA